ncbi:MAG: metallophosphoesterase family protein [Chloroflexota bacterium]
MRYAILADIHANLTAFEAVLADIGRRGGVDGMWCLGDVVGYGPDPCRCLERLRRQGPVVIAGNHDWAAIGKLDTANFNPDAAAACRWTAGQLGPEDRDYLAGLPPVLTQGDFTLAHGSPRVPLWEYLLSPASARENLAYFPSRYCLVGHSHRPLVFRQEAGGAVSRSPFPDGAGLVLGEHRLIINPGGVGQPRDGDPRASYAIYDADAGVVRLHRVAYDVGQTQDRMVAAGLPRRLVARLGRGE